MHLLVCKEKDASNVQAKEREEESVTESLTALSTLTVLFVKFYFKVQHRECAVFFLPRHP